MKKPDSAKIKAFQKTVWDHYKKEGRHNLPWRKTRNPYKILVSEIMLQQTQVDRVIPKYKAFLAAFPNIVSLAKASNAGVLRLWSGLGYNRRALFLKRAAEYVVNECNGKMPKDAESLQELPGVGPYTACAVATFSYGQSYTFIETNIRSVFIHAFFRSEKMVSDEKIIPYIAASLDEKNPREWYFALMDYGSHLKKTLPNPSRKSKHHSTQSRFQGSLRQVRGAYIRACVDGAWHSEKSLFSLYKRENGERAKQALEGLIKEGFLERKTNGKFGGYVKIKR